MNELLQYVLESIVATGLLFGCYRLWLDRRVGYGWSRGYLLGSLLAGSCIPLFEIPVWPAETVVIASPAAVAAPAVAPLPLPVADPTIPPETICAGIWLLGVLLLAGMMLRQSLCIVGLHRDAIVTHHARYDLVQTRQQIAAFSFLRSIYLWHRTPEAELPAIIAHEASHIAHRHTYERLAVEVIKTLLWWNPFAWLTARRLAEVEEFEADHDVLDAGFGREAYMTTIYRQLFGYTPEIANGLPHSLTKKRFQMMTTTIERRGTLLRLAAVVPVLAGLVCAFSFTARATEYRVAGETEPPATAAVPAASAAPETGRTVDLHLTALHEGKPLFGALVLVKGSPQGVVTDREGRAKLSVPVGATVEVSYIDLATFRFTVADDSVQPVELRCELQRENELEEVIVLGMGSKAGSLGTSKRLYVVDGEVCPSIESIPADRIESLNVLKGETARTKYGVAGENGVVEIVLKKEEPQNRVEEIVVVGYVPDETPAGTAASAAAANPTATVAATLSANAAAAAANTGAANAATVATPSAAASSPASSRPMPVVDEKGAFLVAEKMPRFQGGDLMQFIHWVHTQLVYPAEAYEKGISGRVVLKFILSKEGILTNIRVLASPDQSLSDEAVRVLESSPAWTPGEQGGKRVDVAYVIPVTFSLAEEPVAGDDPVYVEAEKMPRFRGGDLRTFRNWVQSKVRFPEEALRARISGVVLVRFIVGLDGHLSSFEVLQSPHPSLRAEVIRVLNASPAWTPGEQGGKRVRVQYTLPVAFVSK